MYKNERMTNLLYSRAASEYLLRKRLGGEDGAHEVGGGDIHAKGREAPVAQRRADHAVHAVGHERLEGVDVVRGDHERLGELVHGRLEDGRQVQDGSGTARAAAARAFAPALDGRQQRADTGLQPEAEAVHVEVLGQLGRLEAADEEVPGARVESPVADAARLHGLLHEQQEVALRDAVDPGARDTLLDGQVLRHEADLQDHAEANCGGGQALVGAVAGEEVQEGVSGAVVALRRGTSHGGDGGEHDEEVQGLSSQALVQVPGSLDLGVDGVLPAREVELAEELVLEGHGALDHAVDGHTGRSDGPGDVVLVGHVSAHDVDRTAARLQALHHGGGVLAVRARTAQERQVAGAALDHEAGEGPAEAAQAADEHVCPVRPELDGVLVLPLDGKGRVGVK